MIEYDSLNRRNFILKLKLFFLSMFILFAMFNCELKAEDKIEKSSYQIFIGYGLGISEMGVTGSLFLKYNYNSLSLGLRNIKNQELVFFGNFPEESLAEYSFLVGIKQEFKNLAIIYSSGIGYSYYLRNKGDIKGSDFSTPYFIISKKYEDEFKSSISVPLEIHFMPNTDLFSASSFTIFATLSPIRSTYGIMLTLSFGKFK